MAGRKPYQRYSDFAYGQHVSEDVFEFRVNEAAEDEVGEEKLRKEPTGPTQVYSSSRCRFVQRRI